MNHMDNQILGLLRANARMTITELANTLNISSNLIRYCSNLVTIIDTMTSL